MTSAAPDFATFERRLRAACQWFNLAPPPLAYDEEDPAGGPLLTDDLIAWMNRPAVPMRWLLNGDHGDGDPHARAADERREREFLEVLRGFDDEEVRLMVEAVGASNRGETSLEDALAEWKRKVEERRAAMVEVAKGDVLGEDDDT